MKQSTFSAVMANNIQNLWQRYSQSLRLLLVMFLTLTASANAWGAEYTITFQSASSDSNTDLGATPNVSNVVSSGTDYVASFSGCSKMYVGTSGIKLGSSKATGTMNFTLATNYQSNIKSIKVVSAKYGSDTGTLTLYSGSTSLKSEISPGTDYTHTFSSPTKVTSLKLETSSKRAYITKIVITTEETATCTTNPIVSAGSSTSITTTTATVSCSGGITSLGSAGCSITSYGFVYGTSSNPTISNTKVQVGTTYTTTGTSFSKELTGLTANTTYYVRPYATNGNGTAYGTQTSFKTLELPKYTVKFYKTSTTFESVTEASVGDGVNPPSMEEKCGDWTFLGWSESQLNSETNTTELELVTLTGEKYYPTEDVDLYPVYTKTTGTGGTTFDKYTQVSLGGIITSGKYLISTGSYTMEGNGKTGVSFSPGSTEKTAYEYTITVDGSYFTIKGPDEKYVGGNDGTSLAFGTTVANDSYRWKYVNSGIQNKSYTTRHIKAYGTTDFRHYTTSNGTLTYLYKRTEKSSGSTYYYSYPQCTTEPSQLATPTGLNVSNITSTSATLSWGEVANASSYMVYITDLDDEEITLTDIEEASVDVTGLSPETLYLWDVVAIGDGTNYTDSEHSSQTDPNAEFTTKKACTDAVNVIKGTPSNGSFTMVSGYQSTCNGSVTVTLSNIQPATGYQFSAITQSGVDAAKVTIDNTAKTVTYAQNTSGTSTINVTFIEIPPTYTVTWMVNGESITPTIDHMFTTNITSGNSITLLPKAPAAPAGCSDKVFVGWTTKPIDSEVDTPPSELFGVLGDFPAVTKNVTYYAVWADEEEGEDSSAEVITTIDFSKQGYQNAEIITSLTQGDLIVTFGEKDAKYYNTGTAVRVYGGGTFTVSATNTINKVVFTFASGEDANTITADTYTSFTSNTWTGSSNSIKFSVTGTSGHRRIQKMTITTTSTSSSTTHTAYTTLCDNTKATVNYDLNDGTGASCESQKVTKGVEFTLCNQTPTKTGYNFAGWSDGTKTYAAGATVTVDDNTTFYASWTAKNITITWNQNYTDCPDATTSNYIYDGEEIAMPTDPTRVGYKFTGWYTASTSGTQVTEVGETNKPTADVIYYAHWAKLYTVTFMASGQVYAKQEFKYLSGETLQLPAAPSAANYACDGYIFDGWSVTEKPIEEATKPTLISTPAITEDVTYYAVWKKATAEGAGEEIFYESFDTTEGTGGNDGKWSGSIATSTAYVDNDGWVGDNFSGADQCMKLGSGTKKGYITTPTLSQLSGNATLSFKAAAWDGSDEKTTLVLSIEGGGSLSQTSVTLKKGAWQTYEVTITGGTSNTKITFAGSLASKSRFFLDEVKVATSGSYNYTTSPSCGPTIVAKEGMWVTSANGQSVKVNVPIAVKSFANNATITGTCANENFVVTQLDNVGNGEHNVVVTYTPSAYGTKEDATITLTAKVGEETISTTTFTLNGRSLPEAFAVVVDKASTYFALPANMPEAGVYTGFNVTLNADKSAVVAAPKTHLYALKSVHKNRFDENGTCVRLEGNNTACLWATNAASGTNIRNWAQLNNADGAQYEWSLYTEDGDTYSISCAAVTENGRILRMYGDNFGMYKSGANVFRLLPVECTEQPTNVQVSAARVTATIAWTNVASCDVKVYLKSNASLVKTLSGVASPVTVTELTETTEYTYTITPVGNVACEVSGAFKTTGPDIDIVEWMTDGVIIQVDKDESVNPKVVIKGEVEHNTGSGVMATELFFSKYFEAHGENKLLAIYNGTGAPIDLSGYEIRSENGSLDLSQFGQTKGTVAPNEEIILVYYDVTDDNKDNIPDHSAEPCAQEQEGYKKWHKLANKSVLAFSGRGSIGLYKDDVLIDVIGSTFPTGTLTKIGKSVNGNECEPEDVQLYVGGVSVNDQSSFFCTNGDNIKTAEVETNYAISTNRCLLIRKNTVTSGADAVATNKAEAGATCGDLSSTFKTLCSEWAGFRIGSGNSNDDEVKEATCDGLGYVGGFDYNKYYREFQTLDDSQTLDDFKYKPEENLYKLRIDNVAQYSCLNIQVQINDPVNGTVLTEQTAQVPILVTAANTTTDGLFSNIIDGDLDASKTRCSTCDVVVLDGATLTKAAAETANDVNQVRNVYVYPGGQLIVPETGNDYKVNSVSFRRVEDAVANAQLSSNLNITASSEKPVYVDVRVNAENWHWFTLPYDCNIADVTWVDGTPAKYGVDWFLSTYDGEKRAATQSGGCWAEYHGETIKAGVGYIVGIAGHPTKSKVKYELRFPMSKEVLAQEVAGTDKTVPVYAWGVDEDMRPTHKGWNLVGNPYLDYYQKNKLNGFGGLRLGGEYVLNQSTGYYEDSGKWDGVTGNLPYVVVPIDGGWSAYDQVLVSSIDLLPFTAYFVQVGNPETENNGDLKDVLFDGDNRGRASIARRAPSSVSEQEEPVIVGVSLTNSKGESDKTSLVIDDKYTDEYEMNADFFKWFGDYYRYYTKPVLYTIGADKQQRAFNALNEEQAAKPISMGTYTAQNGEYTFSLDRRSDLTRVKEVWLHDATESAYVNLMQEDYSFSTERTDGTGRFTLAVTLHPKAPTDITEGREGHSYVTSHQRTLYVNNLPQQARVWVYDAVGKLLVNETTNVYQRAYHLGQAGVYFVRVQSQNGCETLQAVVE